MRETLAGSFRNVVLSRRTASGPRATLRGELVPPPDLPLVDIAVVRELAQTANEILVIIKCIHIYIQIRRFLEDRGVYAL